MKKVLLTIAIVMTMGFCASAQDGFFRAEADGGSVRDGGSSANLALPTQHGTGQDANAPLGSGLLILTALGAGYAVSRKGE